MSQEMDALNGIFGGIRGLISNGSPAPLELTDPFETMTVERNGATTLEEKLTKIVETATTLRSWWEETIEPPADYAVQERLYRQLEFRMKDIGLAAVGDYYMNQMC